MTSINIHSMTGVKVSWHEEIGYLRFMIEHNTSGLVGKEDYTTVADKTEITMFCDDIDVGRTIAERMTKVRDK